MGFIRKSSGKARKRIFQLGVAILSDCVILVLPEQKRQMKF